MNLEDLSIWTQACQFPVCVVSVWISTESEVLSNSVFFVATWPIVSQPLGHVIALTNQRLVTETEGQGQVQTGYLLFVSLMIVSTMFAFSTFFTFSFLQIEFTSFRIFEGIRSHHLETARDILWKFNIRESFGSMIIFTKVTCQFKVGNNGGKNPVSTSISTTVSIEVRKKIQNVP